MNRKPTIIDKISISPCDEIKKFKTFQHVFVNKNGIWTSAMFSHDDNENMIYYDTDGIFYKASEIIYYIGNENKLGTKYFEL